MNEELIVIVGHISQVTELFFMKTVIATDNNNECKPSLMVINKNANYEK